MLGKKPVLEVGALAPELFIDTAAGALPLRRLASRCEKLVLTTQDSYRYHPN